MNIIKKVFDTIEEAMASAIKSKTPTGVQYRAKLKKYVTVKSDITNTKTNDTINEKGGERK